MTAGGRRVESRADGAKRRVHPGASGHVGVTAAKEVKLGSQTGGESKGDREAAGQSEPHGSVGRGLPTGHSGFVLVSGVSQGQAWPTLWLWLSLSGQHTLRSGLTGLEPYLLPGGVGSGDVKRSECTPPV